MKLGISYNMFDGYELLESSVTAMKPMVDHISVVFQETSNNGKTTIDGEIILKLLKRLESDGLIDSIIKFNPNSSKTVHQNEIDKRQTGYNKAKEAGCTHYLSMDVDEFFIEDEFNKAKSIIEDGGYDGAVVDYVNYYGDFNHQIPYDSKSFVPFIYKIDGDRRFQHGNVLTNQFLCDPTRQLRSNKVVKFKPSDIMMHHMSYVRNGGSGMRMKLENSSARLNLINGGDWVIDKMVDYYDEWIAGKRGMKIDNIHGGNNRIVDNVVSDMPLHYVDSMFKFIESSELSTKTKLNEKVETLDEK